MFAGEDPAVYLSLGGPVSLVQRGSARTHVHDLLVFDLEGSPLSMFFCNID